MNCIGSLKGQVWLMERVMAGGGAGVGMPPCALSQRGQVSQKVAAANSWNSALGPGAAEWAGKKGHLLSTARVLKCEVLILFGFYIFLSRQVVSQFQLSACFYLVLLLQWSSIYQSVTWKTHIATARCCPRISLQQCKLTAETTSH